MTQYPGLYIQDDRCGGLITLGESRLPLRSLIPDAAAGGLKQAFGAYELDITYNADPEDFERETKNFLIHLLSLRKDSARVILALSDAARKNEMWDTDDELKKPVILAIKELLESLES